MKYFITLLFALLNRARGSTLFGLTNSTEIGRIVSMLGMAILTSLLKMDDPWCMAEIVAWTFGTLMFWCTPAWDSIWSAEIGNPIITSNIPSWIVWIMSRLWHKLPIAALGKLNMKVRLWGMVAMSIRMLLAVPCVVGLAYIGGNPEYAWEALLTPLLAVPYFVWGLVFYYWPKFDAYTITMAELTVGAILGKLNIFALS